MARAQEKLGGLVVIVDGGSADGTREIAAEEARRIPKVHLIDNPARLQSAGINVAVQRYGDQATHLIRIDAHCGYPADYCETLLSEVQHTGAASVVVSMTAKGSGLFQRAIAAAQNAPVGNGGSKHRTKPKGEYVDHGHHALISIGAFREVGGYDAAFSHNEDAELDHRLRAAGYEIWLTAQTSVAYFPREGGSALARQYFNYGKGRAQNLLKHRSLPKLRQAKVILILPFLALALLAPFSAFFALPCLAWITYCTTMALSQVFGARDPSLALVAPMSMVMHLSWSVGFWSRILVLGPALVRGPA